MTIRAVPADERVVGAVCELIRRHYGDARAEQLRVHAGATADPVALVDADLGPLFICGVLPGRGGGVPWGYGPPIPPSLFRPMLRVGRDLIRGWTARWGVLRNTAPADGRHDRYARMLGFTFTGTEYRRCHSPLPSR